MISRPERLVVIAPNWLGDAVMALPLLADLRRAWPDTHITVAVRPPVAALFAMADDVDAVLELRGGGGIGAMRVARENARRLRHGNFGAALLLPNSFMSAWIAFSAAIAERWGYRSDLRGALLTRAVKRPGKHVHQAAYYQALVSGIGLEPGPPYARLTIAVDLAARAQTLLAEAGVTAGGPFVAMAPGAAYGRAKQWLPDRFAELARSLLAERAIQPVLVGARADFGVCAEIGSAAPGAINLAGRTDLPLLAAVLSLAQAVVANDSGAMHLAASVGARVVAIFGATDEKRTAPLAAGADRPTATILASDVWCRPCMLRECPIDHRGMTSISARDVFLALAG